MHRAFSRPRARAAVVPFLFLAATCAGEPERPGSPLPLDDDAYVEVMAQLELIRSRSFPAEEPETRQALADSARAAVLSDRGVDAAELLRFAEIVGADPGRMEDLYGRIAALADSLREIEAAARDSLEAAARDSLEAAARDSTGAAARGDSTGAAEGRDSLASQDSVPPPLSEETPEAGNPDPPGRIGRQPPPLPQSRPGERGASRRPLPGTTSPDSS